MATGSDPKYAAAWRLESVRGVRPACIALAMLVAPACIAAVACRSAAGLHPPGAAASRAGRFALPGTPATIRPPAGWKLVPIDARLPLVAFSPPGQPPPGESEPILLLQRIRSGEPVQSIDDLASMGCGVGEPVEPPISVDLGDRRVVRCALDSSIDVHAGGRHAVTMLSRRRQYVIPDGGDVYVCGLGLDPRTDSPASSQLLNEFCGSIEFTP